MNWGGKSASLGWMALQTVDAIQKLSKNKDQIRAIISDSKKVGNYLFS